MTAPPKPKLVAVGSPTEPTEGPEPSPAPEARDRVRWLLVGLLVAVLLGGLWLQTQRVGELSSQVEGLSSELAVTQGALRAYEARMGEVRESVAALQAELGSLDELLSRNPTEGAR